MTYPLIRLVRSDVYTNLLWLAATEALRPQVPEALVALGGAGWVPEQGDTKNIPLKIEYYVLPNIIGILVFQNGPHW